MATRDTPIDETKRENLGLTDASHPLNPQHVKQQEAMGSIASQQSGPELRGKKRFLDETDMGTASAGVALQQDSNVPHVSAKPVRAHPSEKPVNASGDKANGQSMSKRPRLEHVECLASEPKIGDFPSGGSMDVAHSGPELERLSTGPTVALFQRQPVSFTNPFPLTTSAPNKGHGDAFHCPTSTIPGIESQDQSSSTIQPLVLSHRLSSEPSLTLDTRSLCSPLSQPNTSSKLPLLYSQLKHLSPAVNNFANVNSALSSYLPLSTIPSGEQMHLPLYHQPGLVTGTASAPHVILSPPTSVSTHKVYQDQLLRFRVPSTPTGVAVNSDDQSKADLDLARKAERRKQLRIMQRATEAEAGRPFVDKRRKVKKETAVPKLSEDSETARFSATTSLNQSDNNPGSCSVSAPFQNKTSFLSNPNSTPESEPPISPSSVTAPLVEEKSHSNSTNVSHTMPSLPGNSSSHSHLPEHESDENVPAPHETSRKVFSTAPPASSQSANPRRQDSTSGPDTSRADSHTADDIPPTLSFPEFNHITPGSQAHSVIEGHADLVLKLVQEDMEGAQRNHDLQMAQLRLSHMEEVMAMREGHSKEVDSIIDAGDNLFAAVNKIKQVAVMIAKEIQDVMDRLHEKLERTESKLKEVRERFEEKLAERKEEGEQEPKDNEKQIACLTAEWLAEKRRLEECIEDARKMRASESEARKALEEEKVAFEQNIVKLNEDKSNYEAVQQKLEIWAKQMQAALEKQAEDHQKMMQKANGVWEERVKAGREIGKQKGETLGFELGKAEVMDQVKELTVALAETEKARAKEKVTWNMEKEKMMEEKRLLEQRQLNDAKKQEELTQQAIKNLDQHWTKEIESRWAKLLATEGKKREEEQARREAEDAARTSEIEKRDRQLAEMEEQLKTLRQELEDRWRADTNGGFTPRDVVASGQFSRMEAKSMLEEYARRGAGPTAPGSRLDDERLSRPDDPCHVQ